MSGKIAPKKISAAMADNLLIRRGQLNRTNRGCQADLKSLVGGESRPAGAFARQRRRGRKVVRPASGFYAKFYCSGKKANTTAARMQTNAAKWFHRIFSPRYKIAKPQNTVSVMTSWMILSCVAE